MSVLFVEWYYLFDLSLKLVCLEKCGDRDVCLDLKVSPRMTCNVNSQVALDVQRPHGSNVSAIGSWFVEIRVVRAGYSVE